MKIIGSDYDGTLNHNGIDANKCEAIRKWREEGNIFAIVSGRGPSEMMEIYRNQHFECDYFVVDSGALILDSDGKVVSEVRCDGALVKPLLALMFSCGCPWGNVLTDFPCRVYENETDGEYTLQNMPDIKYFNQISTMLPDFESASEVTEKIKEHFGGILNPLQNGRCIDVVRADINKAKGILRLMETVGAEYGDVITVGDNVNDADMLEYFRSYAMANGVDSIKALADDITESITELIYKELQ